MSPTLIELNPNRLLLDPNFDGYKLSLQDIPKKRKELTNSVDRVLLNTHQYSLLHANLYGLHNHLVGDPYDDSTSDSVYYIDSELNICKLYVDPFNDEIIEPIELLRLPRNRDRTTGDYNVSLKFVSSDLAVAGDGTGWFYIIDTGSRNDDDNFSICFSDEVAGQDEPFLLLDAVLKGNVELHVLALSLKQEDKNERYYNVVHWITFSKEQDSWGQTALRRVRNNGCIKYCYLEKNCDSIYIVSDENSVFTLNSDVPIVDTPSKVEAKIYKWSQGIEDVTIKIPLPDNPMKQRVKVETTTSNILVKYEENTLISGDLSSSIDSDVTVWSLEGNVLEITLNKTETGNIWPELIKNDTTGEYILETCIVEDVNKLSNFTSANEEIPQTGTTFNSQQVEECDFEIDKTIAFERLCGHTNTPTHRINLGCHHVSVIGCITDGSPPAIGIRHDVDVCLWQPRIDGEQFSIKHEGTLLALGYVQASKQNRKFTACPPNLSYAVICESTGHLFIYRQNKSVANTELRNRSSGRRVNSIAQQQVVRLAQEEVLGIYPANNHLFLLHEKSLTILQL
ncbi:unnamed protein product [Phyllotreta striolata]|uniref:NudC domain-containing protein 1 n=1 Tax=Phyllotreta striolata TaxID=444603 RepID=A0A9N9TNI4_PHYSR|nr:unnamed protein product [Phyllotreta striolata]